MFRCFRHCVKIPILQLGFGEMTQYFKVSVLCLLVSVYKFSPLFNTSDMKVCYL